MATNQGKGYGTQSIGTHRVTRSLLPTGSEVMGVFGVGSIPVAILPPCQHIKLLRCNCIHMNIVG